MYGLRNYKELSLHNLNSLQSEKMEENHDASTAFDIAMKSLEDTMSPTAALRMTSPGKISSPTKNIEDQLTPAVAVAASGMSSPRFRSIHPDSPTATCGSFFETLTSSDFYKNMKVIVFRSTFSIIRNFLYCRYPVFL